MRLCYDHDEFGNLYMWAEYDLDEVVRMPLDSENRLTGKSKTFLKVK